MKRKLFISHNIVKNLNEITGWALNRVMVVLWIWTKRKLEVKSRDSFSSIHESIYFINISTICIFDFSYSYFFLLEDPPMLCYPHLVITIIFIITSMIMIMACRHIPTMTKSHHDGEMSVMMKVGMCQCQIPTIHGKLRQLALVSCSTRPQC